MIRQRLTIVFGLISMVGTACGSAAVEAPPPATPPTVVANQPPSPSPKGSLYQRLGEKAAIGMVVDEFLKRVAADPRINARFLEHGPHQASRVVGRLLLRCHRRPLRIRRS